jgi:hypothetical protein
MTIAIIGCLHGNEVLGKRVIEFLRDRIDARFIIANPPAVEKGVRFIGTDMNRSFPGNPQGSQEETLAHALLAKLEGIEFVIDIHSTTAVTEGFVIAVERSPQALIDAVPLNKVVLMPRAFASGKSLIDHIPGVSLEFHEGIDPASVANVVAETVANMVSSRTVVKEMYVGKRMLQGDAIFENFKQVPGTGLYAILSGEKAYHGTCILCERVSH